MQRRDVLKATAGTAIAALSGCVAITPFNTPHPDELLRSVAAEHDRERPFRATRVVRTGQDSVSRQRTQRFWRLGPDRVRSDVTWSTDSQEVGNVRVADDSMELEYRGADDVVLLRGRTDPVNPADRIVANYDLEYVGTERVGPREVDVVDAVPTESTGGRSVSVRLGDTEYVLSTSSSDDASPDADETIRKRLWIDPELPVFVQERSEVATGDGALVDERTHFSIASDADIDERRFELEPQSAHVSVLKSIPSDGSWTDSNRNRIARRVPFPLPEPDLPDAYSFDEGTVKFDEDVGVVGARLWYQHEYYANRPLFVTVSKRPLIEPSGRDYRETQVSRGSVEGQAVEAFDVENVEWECDGRTYRVGSHPDRELLLEIGESIEC